MEPRFHPMPMLKQQLEDDLKQALRDRAVERRATLRLILAAVKDREIEQRVRDAGLDDEGVLAVLQKQAKQRRDAIEQYDKAGRTDLADGERTELAIVEEYLPAQLSEAEIETAVRVIIDRVGASSPADMGKVMGPAMGALRGKADGKQVQGVVRRLLQTAG